ncbi:PDR/VanB family oxidoreductase [Achromobacter spanius]|uniref:Ferredoxin n=1 Tax=Achromobacter spanius TaxID=217203 RepID=A0AAW3IAQ7_9BURK|nr:PDR/VanB family oxidoreductase [Achromobacter spanius]KNE28997.1 ferredoxin [Achromobacter spanius]
MRPLIVKHITREAQGVVSLLLRSEDGANLPAYEAGAHIDVDVGKGLIRQYSLCGDPAQRDHYRLGVALAPASRGGSRHIHDALRVGDTLRVGEPRQRFGLHAQAAAHVFIAGGIGITPFLGMILACERRGEPWTLLYCARSRQHAAFLEDLAPYPDQVRLHMDDEQAGARCDVGAYLERVSRPASHVYCCGPASLMDAVGRACAERHVPGAHFHTERFSAPDLADRAMSTGATNTGEPASHGVGAFTIVLARSGGQYTVPADKSVLEVLEDAGIAWPHACREGLCGSCEAGVLSGAVDHRDYVLSDAQREGGACMMICVSRASGVLELDI